MGLEVYVTCGSIGIRGGRVAGGGGGRDSGGAEAARVPLELSGWGPPVGLCRGRGERQRQLVPGV